MEIKGGKEVISKIIAKDFKGLSFEQEIGQYTIFIGANGAGKSARSQALTIAILGFLPQDQAKQPSTIYATHGIVPEMIVGFENDAGDVLIRKYKSDSEGVVSLYVTLNGKPVTQKTLDRALLSLGNPQIFDLRAFNELSEQKKIEFLLSLSPPSGDLRQIESEVMRADERVNSLRIDIRGKKGTIEQITGERAGLQLPAGTLAEIQAEIKDKEATLEETQKELKDLELAEQKRKDEEKAKEREQRAKEEAEIKARNRAIEAEAKAKKDKENAEAKAKREVEAAKAREAEFKQREADALRAAEIAQEDLSNLKAEMGQQEKIFEFKLQEAFAKTPRGRGAESLRKVRETLIEANCDACAALIILNLELQEYEGE